MKLNMEVLMINRIIHWFSERRKINDLFTQIPDDWYLYDLHYDKHIERWFCKLVYLPKNAILYHITADEFVILLSDPSQDKFKVVNVNVN